MALFYPQAVLSLRVLWEDFGKKEDTILQEVYSFNTLARSLTVNINDYTQADTFSAELDYKNFPFDPRTIRSLGVQIYIQDMGSVFQKNNKLNNLIPDEKNIVFSGFADEESINFDELSRTVKIEGRDFTSLLIDAPYDKGPIIMDKPINLVVQELLDGLPSVAALEVEIRGIEGDLPTLKQFAPDFNPLAGAKNGKRAEKYWDVIQGLITRAGLIAFMEIDKLIISKPRALFNKENAKQFVYGKNIKSLSFKRKLGRQKGFNIRVVSLDLEGKRTVEAKIPEEASTEFSKALGLAKERIKIKSQKSDGTIAEKDAPFFTFRLADIRSKDHLIAVGESIFEEIGRQQIEGDFETLDMCVDEGTIQNPVRFDFTKIRVATPIEIEIDQGDQEGVSRLKTEAQREKFLVSRCYTPSVAKALARTMGKFDTPFYTRAVEFNVDNDRGFRMKLDFVNFIELSNSILEDVGT